MTTPAPEEKNGQQPFKKVKGVANLYRYTKSKTFLMRAKVGGKLIHKSLDTKSKEIAIIKLNDRLRLERKRAPKRGANSVSAACDAFLDYYRSRPSIKARSKKAQTNAVEAILKIRPEWVKVAVDDITEQDCHKFATDAAERYMPSQYNHVISALKQVMEKAVDNGHLLANPAARLERRRIHRTNMDLPTGEQLRLLFNRLYETPRARPAWMICKISAGTGLRISEVKNLRVQDVDMERKEIYVRHSKNGRDRYVPMIRETEQFFREILPVYPHPHQHFVTIDYPKRAIKTACKALKIPKMTPHSFRHFFATRCIEDGVDPPTVARWLGHQDGGALVMKVYVHGRTDHSRSMAAKVGSI